MHYVDNILIDGFYHDHVPIFSPREVIKLVRQAKNYFRLREKSFDWLNIDCRKRDRRKLLHACRRYGKVKRKPHGFIIHF